MKLSSRYLGDNKGAYIKVGEYSHIEIEKGRLVQLDRFDMLYWFDGFDTAFRPTGPQTLRYSPINGKLSIVNVELLVQFSATLR